MADIDSQRMALVAAALKQGAYSTAALLVESNFKLFSNSIGDVYSLAQTFFLDGQYQRSLGIIESSGLLASAELLQLSKQLHGCVLDGSIAPENVEVVRCRIDVITLAARNLIKMGSVADCVSLVEGFLKSIFPEVLNEGYTINTLKSMFQLPPTDDARSVDAISGNSTSNNNNSNSSNNNRASSSKTLELHPVSLLYGILGSCFHQTENRAKAETALRLSLQLDIANLESFHLLCENSYIHDGNAKQLWSSVQQFAAPREWLLPYYRKYLGSKFHQQIEDEVPLFRGASDGHSSDTRGQTAGPRAEDGRHALGTDLSGLNHSGFMAGLSGHPQTSRKSSIAPMASLETPGTESMSRSFNLSKIDTGHTLENSFQLHESKSLHFDHTLGNTSGSGSVHVSALKDSDEGKKVMARKIEAHLHLLAQYELVMAKLQAQIPHATSASSSSTGPTDDQLGGGLSTQDESIGFTDVIMLGEQLYQSQYYHEAYQLVRKLYLVDSFHQLTVLIYVDCMVALALKHELYYLAHELIESNPTSHMGWYAIGGYYFICQKNELAKKYLSKCIKINKRFPSAYILLGHAMNRLEEKEHAIAAYRTASCLLPSSHQPLLYLSQILIKLNNLPLASHFLSLALKLSPSEPAILNEWGVVYFMSGKYSESRDFFHKACYGSADGGDEAVSQEIFTPTMLFEIFSNAGVCHRKLRNYPNALRCFFICSTIYPKDAMTLGMIAFTYHLMRRFRDAIEYYHRALGIDGQSAFLVQMMNRAIDDLNYFEENEDVIA